MSEPRRLKERSALPGQLAAALEGAPGDASELELRTLARGLELSLGIALAAPTAAANLPTALSAGAGANAAVGHGAHLLTGLAAKPSLSFLAWFGAGLALGTLISATVLLSPALLGEQRAVTFRPAPSASAAARVARVPVPVSASATAQLSAQPQPQLPNRAAEIQALRLAPEPVSRPVVREESHEESAAHADTELSLLRRAQQTLRADPARALDLCAAHAAQFPAGAMAQEREIIAIEALQQLGRTEDMRARALGFLKQFPGSAHAAHLEQLLGRKEF